MWLPDWLCHAHAVIIISYPHHRQSPQKVSLRYLHWLKSYEALCNRKWPIVDFSSICRLSKFGFDPYSGSELNSVTITFILLSLNYLHLTEILNEGLGSDWFKFESTGQRLRCFQLSGHNYSAANFDVNRNNSDNYFFRRWCNTPTLQFFLSIWCFWPKKLCFKNPHFYEIL